jgi:hypothetical protein
MKTTSVITGTLVAALVALLPAGSALAAGGTIYACVGKALGIVRIVASASGCTSLETPISWNAQGPAGPQGAAGPAGPTGPTGPTGPAGVTAGINAALFAEVDFDPGQPDNCSIGFFRGADSATGVSTGNDNECWLNFKLPAGQAQSWGTAYECFTSNEQNTNVFDFSCAASEGFDSSGAPQVLMTCRTSGGGAVNHQFYEKLLCTE